MIKKGVYYKNYDGTVYVRDSVLRLDHIMNDTAADVLDFFRENPNGTHNGLVDFMVKKYPECKRTQLDEDMLAFENELTAAGILEEKKRKENSAESVPFEILDLCTKNHTLFSVTMELTYRCSEKCIHCYVENGGYSSVGELTLSDYKKIIDRIWELGCMNILFTGGEVCLKKDFLDIVRYAVNKGIPVNIYTNGISMTDEQFDALCEMKVNSVSFSLYGGTVKVHDAISKVKGSFEKTLKRMMMFKCAGIETYIKTVIIKQNCDDYENLLKLGKRLGLAVQTSLMVMPPAGMDASDLRLGNVDEYEKMLMLQNKYFPASSEDYTSDTDRPICGCGQYMLSINPFGDVFPCISMPIKLGNILENDIGEIWANSDILKKYSEMRFLNLDKKCSECPYATNCGVCIGEIQREYGCLRHSEEGCMIAEASSRMSEHLRQTN